MESANRTNTSSDQITMFQEAEIITNYALWQCPRFVAAAYSNWGNKSDVDATLGINKSWYRRMESFKKLVPEASFGEYVVRLLAASYPSNLSTIIVDEEFTNSNTDCRDIDCYDQMHPCEVWRPSFMASKVKQFLVFVTAWTLSAMGALCDYDVIFIRFIVVFGFIRDTVYSFVLRMLMVR